MSYEKNHHDFEKFRQQSFTYAHHQECNFVSGLQTKKEVVRDQTVTVLASLAHNDALMILELRHEFLLNERVACEQAFHLRTSRQVTRDRSHGKRDSRLALLAIRKITVRSCFTFTRELTYVGQPLFVTPHNVPTMRDNNNNGCKDVVVVTQRFILSQW